jgi:hypothetical protein
MQYVTDAMAVAAKSAKEGRPAGRISGLAMGGQELTPARSDIAHGQAGPQSQQKQKALRAIAYINTFQQILFWNKKMYKPSTKRRRF